MGDVIEPVQAEHKHMEQHGAYDLWVRRLFVGLLVAVVALALFNVFGQRATDASVHTPSADLILRAPHTARPGLMFQTRITIVAHADLPKTTLVLSHGWFDGLTLNTNEPSASAETSGPGGSVAFSLGHLTAGETYVDYFEYQVNPTSTGGRPQSVTLQSNGVTVATLSRSMTLFP